MTPPRLLGTTRNDFERDLLRSAALDHAPSATRQRVLSSVARALASAGANDALTDEKDLELEPAGTSFFSRASAVPPLRRRASRYVGVLALAASMALVLWQGGAALRRATGEDASASALLEPLSRSGTRTLGDGESAQSEVPASSEAQRSLANTSAVVPRLQSGTVLDAANGADASDWLGAQLQLLGEARRQLDLGSLEQAHGLLDSYERRFPDGVLGPQISALRAELLSRQRRARTASQ